jgi:prepilin signal peptidase PulO-like enzyme (type II secretory pathway)
MRKNYLLNILYTIGIALAVIIGYQYGVEQKQYGFLAGAIVLVVIFVVLKIKLLKDINKTLQKP